MIRADHPGYRHHIIMHDLNEPANSWPPTEGDGETLPLKPLVIMLFVVGVNYSPNMERQWQEDVRVYDKLWADADTDNISITVGVPNYPGFDDTTNLYPSGATPPADIDLRELGDYQGAEPAEGWMTLQDWKDWHDAIAGAMDPSPHQVLAWGEEAASNNATNYTDFLSWLEQHSYLSVVELEDFTTHPADALTRWLRHVNTLLQLIKGISWSEIPFDASAQNSCRIIGGTPA